MKIFGLIFGGVAVSMLLALSGIGITIWGIVKLVNNKQEPEKSGSV